MACLLYLLANHQRAVPRDELIKAVWGHTHLSDGALAQTIFQLRSILVVEGVDAPIRSVRGFGYRWALPVETCAPPAGTAQDPPSCTSPGGEPRPGDARRRFRAWPLLAVSALAVLGLWAVGWLHRSAPESTETALLDGTPNAVMVLPVESGNDPERTWMRLGLMDLLASRLRAAGVATVPVETTLALVAAAGGGEGQAGSDAQWSELTAPS